MIVCKFGGSATAKDEGITNIKEIAGDYNRRIFIFSAIGKSDFNDEKTTDLLIDFAQSNLNKKIIIKKIKQKFNKLLQKIKKKLKIYKKINNFIQKYLNNQDDNYLISRGEYLTAFIMSKYLNLPFVPAERILHFKNNNVDEIRTKQKLQYYLTKYRQFVVPGFYGINEKGKIHLLSRGGSDVTGAVFAKLSKARVYENWTDEDGIKEVNPKYFSSNTIDKMNYNQLAVMTACDAKVLHQDCANILKRGNVETCVCNVLNVSGNKTFISKKYKQSFFISVKKVGNGYVIVSPRAKIKTNESMLETQIKQQFDSHYMK